MCGTEGLGDGCAGWSSLLGMEEAGVLPGQLHRNADVWEGHLSFSTLLRNHMILPQMNHLPESQVLLQEYGDHLIFHFPSYP